MSNFMEISGGQPQKQPKSVPFYIDRAIAGLVTNRWSTHDPSDLYSVKYIGGKPDAIWTGLNVELTNQLTIQRRPGLSTFSGTGCGTPVTYPTAPDRAFSFEEEGGTIQVLIDTGSSGSLVVASVAPAPLALVLTGVATSSGGVAVYSGTITGGAANALVGLTFTVTGFVTTSTNNGTFVATASSPSTLTLKNAMAVSETQAGTASASYAVYTGTFPAGATNAYAGLTFTFSGFANTSNNGPYVVINSTTTTLTVANPTAVSETITAAAVSAGAVFIDNQDCTKTLLFAKSPGAGQGYFVAVGGILYYGDGIDLKKYVPGGTNGTVFNWQSAGPTLPPTLVVTESGVASTLWTASTFWSTMGLVYDATTGDVFQLISVNASTTNTTQFGTSGNGQPPWNQLPGGTTPDNTITWTNFGPIVAWTAHTIYKNGAVGGTIDNPCIVYDPNTKSCYENATPGGASATSGSSYPAFKAGVGQFTFDGGIKWAYVGTPGKPSSWVPNHLYPKYGTVSNNTAVCTIVEPAGLENGLPTNQTLFWQTSNGGTSGSGGTTPFVVGSTEAGTPTFDNDLVWLSLGSFTRTVTTPYSEFTVNGAAFSAIKDPNGNWQVCTTTGISSATATSSITWSVGYGNPTADGTVIWTCVGTATPWVASTKWYLPVGGFTPPTSSSSVGGASIIDNTAGPDVEFIVNSGLGGSSQPTWNTLGVGSYTADNSGSPPPPFTLTQVAVSGTTTTYMGTVTGGGTPANAFAGRVVLISGFTTAGNNGLFTITASTATTIVVTTSSQVNETHAGLASINAIWLNESVFTTQSLAWSFGIAFSYAYKARSLTDFYSVNVAGTNKPPIPPGANPYQPLPAPTGSETGAITSASPAVQIVGANLGAVITISGIGPTDPQYDTIVIYASADSASGSGQMFEATEIPAPPPIGGQGQSWSFRYFLPFTPTTIGGISYPGLNPLFPAPINGANDPPPAGFLPMVYNFNRIWGVVGNQVFFSQGPDVALPANPSEAFLASDEFEFLATVIRVVKTSQGLVVFLTDSIEAILGGPATASFYTVTVAPGIGLSSYNALDVLGGEIYFFSSDLKLRTMTPTTGIQEAGFAIGDQLSNMPVSGVSDATWDPSKAYVAIHQNGLDNCLMIADGSTGWYRLNPQQHNANLQGGAAPVWSPFAAITGGCKMVQSIESAPGIKKLLVGPVGAGGQILYRNLSVFTDNGTQYDANFTLGAIMLVHPGQRTLLRFVEMDFSGVNYKPTVSYLINEIAGTFIPFTLDPIFEPPSLYGDTTAPTSYSPNRYYFSGTGKLAVTRFMFLKCDFGTTAVGNQVANFTISGRLVVE